MSRVVSIGTMIKQINGLRGTEDVNAWEDNFIMCINTETMNGTQTQRLSENKINVIEKLYRRHFA